MSYMWFVTEFIEFIKIGEWSLPIVTGDMPYPNAFTLNPISINSAVLFGGFNGSVHIVHFNKKFVVSEKCFNIAIYF